MCTSSYRHQSQESSFCVLTEESGSNCLETLNTLSKQVQILCLTFSQLLCCGLDSQFECPIAATLGGLCKCFISKHNWFSKSNGQLSQACQVWPGQQAVAFSGKSIPKGPVFVPILASREHIQGEVKVPIPRSCSVVGEVVHQLPRCLRTWALAHHQLLKVWTPSWYQQEMVCM